MTCQVLLKFRPPLFAQDVIVLCQQGACRKYFTRHFVLRKMCLSFKWCMKKAMAKRGCKDEQQLKAINESYQVLHSRTHWISFAGISIVSSMHLMRRSDSHNSNDEKMEKNPLMSREIITMGNMLHQVSIDTLEAFVYSAPQFAFN